MSNAPPNNDHDQTSMPERPVDTLRDGSLKASIWKNETERGVAFNTTFTRSYQTQDGQWAETQSIPSKDLLRHGELSRAAHSRVNELRQEHHKSQEEFRAARQDQTNAKTQSHTRER